MTRHTQQTGSQIGIFVSWSGKRSQKIAIGLKEFLEGMFPPPLSEIWTSAETEPGRIWINDILKQLEKLNFGILCLTPENLRAPWLHFEAGALLHTVKKTRVCPYLFDMGPEGLAEPFRHFQATRATREGTLTLVKSIHCQMATHTRRESQLASAFEVWWPTFHKTLKGARRMAESPQAVTQKRLTVMHNTLLKFADMVTAFETTLIHLTERK